MEFRDFTLAQIKAAVGAIRDKYPTLRFDATRTWTLKTTKAPRVTGVLRVGTGTDPGARSNADGRRTNTCSWDCHYDFMAELYKANPEGVIIASLIRVRYNGAADFFIKCGKAATVNVGPRCSPVPFGDLTCVPAA